MYINEFHTEGYQNYVRSRSLATCIFSDPIEISSSEAIIFDGALPDRDALLKRFFPTSRKISALRVDAFEDVLVAGAGAIFTKNQCAIFGAALDTTPPDWPFREPWCGLRLQQIENEHYSCENLEPIERLESAYMIAGASSRELPPYSYRLIAAFIFLKLFTTGSIHS